MIKYNWINGIKSLVYKSCMSIKNKVLETLKKPYKIIGLAIKAILPIMVFPVLNVAAKRELPIPLEWGVVAIPLAVLAVNCYWLFKPVRNAQFSLGDVNLLFTSPMPKGLMYMWSMGKMVLFTLAEIVALLMMPDVPSPLRLIGLVLAFITLGTQILRCILYSKDFFEDAANTAVQGKLIKEAVSNRDIDSLSSLSPVISVGENKPINIKGKYKDAMAFLWKSILENKRKKDGLPIRVLKILGFTTASIALGFFTKGKTLTELILPVFVFGNVLQAVSSSLFSGVEYELKKSYVFLLPGSFLRKVLALNLIPMAKTILMNTVIAISLFTIGNQPAINSFIIWLAISSMTVTNLYSIVIFKGLFSNQTNKTGLFKLAEGLNELVIQIPGFALAYVSYLIISKISVALFIFSVCNLLLLGLILYYSETAFGNLEVL